MVESTSNVDATCGVCECSHLCVERAVVETSQKPMAVHAKKGPTSDGSAFEKHTWVRLRIEGRAGAMSALVRVVCMTTVTPFGLDLSEYGRAIASACPDERLCDTCQMRCSSFVSLERGCVAASSRREWSSEQKQTRREISANEAA